MPLALVPPDGWVVQARYPGPKLGLRHFASMFTSQDEAIEAVRRRCVDRQTVLRTVCRVSPETIEQLGLQSGEVREFE